MASDDDEMKTRDDEVGRQKPTGPGHQTAAQRAVLGGGGEEGGAPEPKGADDWTARGAPGGEPVRASRAIGGNSQGQADRMPADPGARAEPATNPKTRPGHEHEA